MRKGGGTEGKAGARARPVAEMHGSGSDAGDIGKDPKGL
jgi:hypothetical protein